MGGQTYSSRRINSWRSTRTESRYGMSLENSKWFTKIEGLWESVQRFKMAQIENRNFQHLIPKFNHPNTLLYADPPYVHETRTGSDNYLYEMTTDDHILLAKLLNETTCKVALSGYPSELYKELYPASKWIMHTGPKRNTNLGKKKGHPEILWTNYKINQHQLDLK